MYANKAERMAVAKQWNEEMERVFVEEIVDCVGKSRIYRGNGKGGLLNLNPRRPIDKIPDVSFVACGTVPAAKSLKELANAGFKVCILNFASYKNPGGRFLDGSLAQEENLCHHSYLYNILKRMMPYYEWNRNNLNYAMYTDAAIYTPDVRFFERADDCTSPSFLVDVLTCAAPNFSANMKSRRISYSQNMIVFERRIHFMYNVCNSKEVDYLVAGAWGCGVFGQDPKFTVCSLLDSAPISGTRGILFAVPESTRDDDYNCDTFRDEIEKFQNNRLKLDDLHF